MPKKLDLILVPTDFSGLSCEAFPYGVDVKYFERIY